jgi:signal transduction histidine kinase/HPt (histidine-containing phosphotransfer) domain-containing protein
MLNGKTVLTIDDSDTIRTYLRNVLSGKGAQVEGASTGQEGLLMCSRQPYDLILLDLLMPDIDGIEVLKQIRTANDESTVVMLTGHGGIKSAIAAVQMGADGYILKQDITSTARDHVEFAYALEQAMEHRAGIVAQKQLEQVRADFYSMVTHDLRNPTTMVLLASTMLTDGSVDPLLPSQTELVELIQSAGQRLIQLINDYLDFAKIDAGYLRLTLGEVDLREVIESSAHFSRLQANAKQQRLTLDLPGEPVIASVDAERLKQVLDNLLSNAIKYTPEGGQIALRLAVEAGCAIFRVTDNGIGIPAQQIPLLFTKYHRVPGETTRGIHGTGLGLLIVKEIVEAHRGTVTTESEGVPGKGTTFTISLPLTPSDQVIPLVAHDTPLPRPLPAESLPEIEDPELYAAFVDETRQQIAGLRDVFRDLALRPADRVLFDRAQRLAHTLKGNAGAMGIGAIWDPATQLDSLLRRMIKDSDVFSATEWAVVTQLIGAVERALP